MTIPAKLKRKRPTRAKKSVLIVEAPNAKVHLRSIIPEAVRSTLRIRTVHSLRQAEKLLRPRFDTRWARTQITERLIQHLPVNWHAHVQKPNGVPQQIVVTDEHNEIVPANKVELGTLTIISSIEGQCRKTPFDAVIVDVSIPLTAAEKSHTIPGIGMACVTQALAVWVPRIALRTHDRILCNVTYIPNKETRMALVFTDHDLGNETFLKKELQPYILGR